MPRTGKVLAGFALVLGLPTAVFAAFHDLISRHPGVAAFLVIGYECLVMLVALLGKAIGGPIDRRARQLGEFVDAALERQISRYGRHYRRHVREELRFTQTMGLGIVGPFTPELDDVYVDVGLAPRPPFQIPSHLLGDVPQDVTDRSSIMDWLNHDKPTVLAVIGAPGSGKTSLLRNVARHAAAGKRQRRNTPILIAVRDHAVRIAENPRLDLPTLLRSYGVALKTREPDGWWEQQLHNGRCLILLDGLDDVAAQEHRRAVVNWVERRVAQYPGNDYVVTSRPDGYRTATLTGATVLQVRPFTTNQVKQFLYGWYSATERFATGQHGRHGERAEALEHVESRAREQANDLLRRLAEVPALYDLTINPLLLTMIANVHRYSVALPGSRAELYREICQSVLGRRREAVDLPVRLPVPDTQRLLAVLAYEMMRRRDRDLSLTGVVEIVEPGLRRMPETATVEDFLAEIQASGLIIERERHTYAFAHHTFGEYLATRHIRDSGLQQVLIDSVNDPWWRETTVLYVTDTNADEVVQACLDSATVTSLSLAFECVQVGKLAPYLRERLNQTLTEATNASDPERRRLAAGVMATRQLGGHVTTTTGSRVCPRPVSTDLYKLFLRDTDNPAPDGVADFVASTERPITGVWASDAKAFTEWVNEVIGAGTGIELYRLPRPEEIDDIQETLTGASRISVWVSTGAHGQPQLWRSPDAARLPHPHTLTKSELITATSSDALRSSGLPSLSVLNAASAARATALALASVLAHHRALDGALDRALDLILDIDIAADRALALDLALDLDRALAFYLALDHAFYLDLDVDLDLALDRAFNRAFDRAFDRALDLTLDIDIDRAVNPARGLFTELTGSPALGVFPKRYEDLVPALREGARRSGASIAIREAVMGFGLASAFLAAAKVRRRKGQPRQRDELMAAFVSALTAPLGQDDNRTFTVDPDTLAPTLQDACERVRNTEGCTSWASYMAGQLRAAAEPIFMRHKPVTSDDAAFIRLGALALAAEPNQVARHEFYTIAAGITLLQRRATNDTGTESIVLARE